MLRKVFMMFVQILYVACGLGVGVTVLAYIVGRDRLEVATLSRLLDVALSVSILGLAIAVLTGKVRMVEHYRQKFRQARR